MCPCTTAGGSAAAATVPKRRSMFRNLSVSKTNIHGNDARVAYVAYDPDANMDSKFKGNSISTGKYNPVTFFPKGFYEQFRRVANLYFLSVAVISLFDAISPIKPYTIWSPLILVVGPARCYSSTPCHRMPFDSKNER